MMSHTAFQIIYDGPALEDSTMDVRDLAPALLALGDVIEQANGVINDKKAVITLKVRASFKTGCFGIEFDVAQTLLEQTKSLFTASGIADAKDIVDYIGFACSPALGLVGFMKWLKGRKITHVEHVDGHKSIIKVNDESTEVDDLVIALYRDIALRKALAKAVTEQLDKDGIDSVAFRVGIEPIFNVIEKDERHWFQAVGDEEEISDNTVRMVLVIESPVFKKDNKWKFNAGGPGFFAAIEDADFLSRVESGSELFGKGDYLTAQVNVKQFISMGSLKTEYVIIHVLDHKRPPSQSSLLN